MKMMKTRDIVSNIIFVLSLALLLITVYEFLQYKKTGKSYDILGIKPVVIMSGSMEPTLSVDSLVFTLRTEAVEKGDIIMFRQGDSYVVHRYYGDTEDGSIITKGDNNKIVDYKPVSRNDIYGKVICTMNFLSPLISSIMGHNGIAVH